MMCLNFANCFHESSMSWNQCLVFHVWFCYFNPVISFLQFFISSLTDVKRSTYFLSILTKYRCATCDYLVLMVIIIQEACSVLADAYPHWIYHLGHLSFIPDNWVQICCFPFLMCASLFYVNCLPESLKNHTKFILQIHLPLTRSLTCIN